MWLVIMKGVLINLVYICYFTEKCVLAAAPVFIVPSTGVVVPDSVAESIAPNSSVLTLVAQDDDADALTYSIKGQIPSSPPFYYDSATDDLRVPAGGLDAENSQTFVFVFRVSDSTSTVDSEPFILTVNDVNEYPPVFSNDSYSGSAKDGDPTGTLIFTVNATDRDVTATMTYSITAGNVTDTFILDGTTGEVTIGNATNLDSLTTPSYTLNITASDSLFTATVQATIKVSAPPYFVIPKTGALTEQSVNESMAPGSSVLTLRAVDPNADNLTFSIKSQNSSSPASPAFYIDATTDELRVPVGGLDAETSQRFNFVFSVSDGTYTVDSDSFTLTITDVNEYTPVFSPTSYTGNTTNENAAGTLIFTVTATDQDVTATITYSITAGNTPDTFTIDGTTGDVTIGNAVNVDSSTTPSYTLNITASDGVNNDTVQATITVSDGAPSFVIPKTGAITTKAVNESIASGSAVLKLMAVDPNADSLNFSIKSQIPSSPAFDIDAETDELRVPAGGLDTETSQIFSFVFSVSDGTQTVDSEPFTLRITDVNEYSPVFSNDAYAGSATDGDPAGTLIFTVTATDQDVTATITYSITAGNTPDTFTIDGTTGDVTIGNAVNVDSSTTPSYTLNITASDGVNNDTVQATITVSDGAPSFVIPKTGAITTKAVNESIASGSAVLKLMAVDPNADSLNFSIKSQIPSSPAFDIDAETDELRVPAGGLDTETSQIFSFVFSVSDGTQTVDSEPFTLRITDVNEYSPVFSNDAYAGSATDGDPAGTLIFTVTATDQDVTATITYSITAGNTPDTFTIDGTTGDVTIGNAVNVDSSTTPSYTLNITASDGVNTDTVQATITVSDGAPSFVIPKTGAITTKAVNESIASGSAVLKLMAVDPNADSLNFSIKSQIPSSPAFDIDAETDELRVPAGGLDTETSQIFSFVFSVSDGTQTVDSEPFTLRITDVNEYSPVFSNDAYAGSATDGDPAGTLILTVAATDQDATDTVTYSITAGNIPDTFTIDGTTGEVTIRNAANVDSSTTPSYTLNITASDGSLSTTVNATITVYKSGGGSGSNRLKDGTKAGIAIGGFVAIVALSGGIYFAIKAIRRKQSRQNRYGI